MTELSVAELSLRRAGRADADAVLELTRLAYAKWIPLLGREATPTTEDYGRIVREDLVDLLFADGELAALVWAAPRSDHLLIESLAVKPSHQGRGYGRRLLAHAECLAGALGSPVVRLYTNRLFASNIALYERSGYAIDREEAFWGGVKIHMSKRLKPAPAGREPSGPESDAAAVRN